MKHCRKCEVPLVVGENWTASRERQRGYICKGCAKSRSSEYRKANLEREKARQAEYRKANREKIKASGASYYKANREKMRANREAWRKENMGKFSAYALAYAKANPGRRAATQAKRRALLKAQTPSWYDHVMVTEIYEVASEFGYHVDHIVPLANGGLHSHENLQLLTPEENSSKGAREVA